jgi:hypothetical protein
MHWLLGGCCKPSIAALAGSSCCGTDMLSGPLTGAGAWKALLGIHVLLAMLPPLV